MDGRFWVEKQLGVRAARGALVQAEGPAVPNDPLAEANRGQSRRLSRRQSLPPSHRRSYCRECLGNSVWVGGDTFYGAA